ncbi:MAG: TraR/DksA C4-type zinc finger protein [Patescibacteria group bacterium]|jgi:RNA polymerase-binding protein DksA
MTKTANSKFSEGFIEKMKAILIADKARLEKELAKYSTSEDSEDKEAKFPDYGNSEEDNALEVADYEANLSIESDLQKSFRDVEASLDRIEEGEYGVCKYCKKTIEEKRLMARPTSSACISCKKTIVQEV